MPPQTKTIKVHYNSQNDYTLTPETTHVTPPETVLFEAEVQDATITFSPTNTLFGASVNVYVSGSPAASFPIPAGSPAIDVQFCPAALGQSCVPPPKFADNISGSIKVS